MMLINCLPMLVLDAHKMLGFGDPSSSLSEGKKSLCLSLSLSAQPSILILCRLVNDQMQKRAFLPSPHALFCWNK